MSAARTLTGAVVAAALAVTTAGCSSDAGPGAQPTASATPTSPSPSASRSATDGAPTEIEVAVYGDQRRLRTYRRIAAAFEAEHPGVTVTLHKHPDAESAADDTLDALERGTAADVFLTDQRHLPELVDTAGLQPVDDLLEARGVQFGDDYQRVALTSLSADNRLQCMPAEMSPRVVYLNNKLVPRRQLAADEIVVPDRVETSWTWSEFATTARTVAGSDRLGPTKGVYLPPEIETLTALVRSADGAVVDEVYGPSTLTLSSDEALEAIGEILTLARDPVVSLTARDLERRDALTWFTEGRLGLYVGTRRDLPQMRAAEGLRFDVAPLPSFGRPRSASAVNGYCINASTDHLDAAGDFVAFATGEEASAIAARSDVIVPARLDTVAEAAFRQPGQEPRNSQVFAGSLRRSEPMPHDSAWPEVVELVEGALGRLFYDLDVDASRVLEKRMTRLDERSAPLLEETG